MQNVVISVSIAALIVVALFLCASAPLRLCASAPLRLCAYAAFSRGRLATALLVAGLLTALTGLAVGVHTHGWVTACDGFTTSWFMAHRSVEFDVASIVIDRLGSPTATVMTGLVVALLLSRRARSAIPGVVVIGTVGAAALAENGIKALVERPRSPAELQLDRLPWVPPLVLEDHPFPSGHVAGTTALLGIIVVCVGARRSRTVRAWLTGLVVAGAVVVAVSRVYLGFHWLTDVVGGGILGGVFVTLGAALFSAIQAPSGRGGATPRASGLSVAGRRSVVDVKRAGL